jgi:hypothetical protein
MDSRPCGCPESLDLRRQIAESAAKGLTCSACGLGCGQVYSGKCAECWAGEAERLRAALEKCADMNDWGASFEARAALGIEGNDAASDA